MKRVLLLPGDYIGQEIVPEARRVLEAVAGRHGLELALEEALKGDDKADIEAKMQALSEASASLAQKMYAEEAQAAGMDGAPGADGAGTDGTSGADDDAVDAEFEEVKDDEKKD